MRRRELLERVRRDHDSLQARMLLKLEMLEDTAEARLLERMRIVDELSDGDAAVGPHDRHSQQAASTIAPPANRGSELAALGRKRRAMVEKAGGVAEVARKAWPSVKTARQLEGGVDKVKKWRTGKVFKPGCTTDQTIRRACGESI